jgi:hypothetical protein
MGRLHCGLGGRAWSGKDAKPAGAVRVVAAVRPGPRGGPGPVARRRGAKAARALAVAGAPVAGVQVRALAAGLLAQAGVRAQARALAVAGVLAQAGVRAAGQAGQAVPARVPGAAETAAARTGGRAPAGPLEVAIARVPARPGRAVPRRGRAVPAAGPAAAARTGAVTAHALARVPQAAPVAGQDLTGPARALTQEGPAGPARAGRPPPGPPAVAEAPGLPGPARAVAGDTAVAGRRPGMPVATAATAGRQAAGQLARGRPGGPELLAGCRRRDGRGLAVPGLRAAPGRRASRELRGIPGALAGRRRRDGRGPALPGLRAAPGVRADRGLRADRAVRARFGPAVLPGLAMQVLAGIGVARRAPRLRSRSTARGGPVRVPCPRCPRT